MVRDCCKVEQESFVNIKTISVCYRKCEFFVQRSSSNTLINLPVLGIRQ